MKVKYGVRENEVAILRRAERFMVRVMCDVKLVDMRNTMELLDMLGLKETEAGKGEWREMVWSCFKTT